ncbi:MAG: hypothetical protein P4L76_07155 [Beijerinckiaceae bacterium]|nr:hypothetical protein [Beijerinckiaceae bacterium]
MDTDIMSVATEQNSGEQAGQRTADDPNAKRIHKVSSPSGEPGRRRGIQKTDRVKTRLWMCSRFGIPASIDF